MPRNGSGTYVAPSSSFNPAVANDSPLPGDWNTLLADISTTLTQSVAYDGQTTTTARVPFAIGVSAGAGTVSAPGYAIVGDTDTGFYAPAANQIAAAAGGVAVWTATSTAITFPLAATFAGVLTASAGVVGNVTGNVTGNLTGNVTGNASTATTAAAWTTARDLSLTGDGTATLSSVNGSANVSAALTLAATGISAGTYTKITVDAKGRATAGTTLVAGDLPAASTTAQGAIELATQAEVNTGTDALRAVAPSTLKAADSTCKAWGVVTISGTTPTTQDSYGVTSVTRISTGIYEITLTTAMATQYYSIVATARKASANNGIIAAVDRVTAPTTTVFRLGICDNGATQTDPEEFYFQVFGR